MKYQNMGSKLARPKVKHTILDIQFYSVPTLIYSAIKHFLRQDEFIMSLTIIL